MKSGSQGHIQSVLHDGIPCMLKSPRGGLLRPFSRWTLRREWRIYQRLEGIEGVPRCFGFNEAGLFIETIHGRTMSEYRKGEISVEFLDALDRLVSDIHGRGVVHSDLKKRENILVVDVQDGGRGVQRPVIIDFGAAFVQGDIFFETFRRIDLAAAAKLRAHHQPSTVRSDQEKIMANPTWAERLSRFLIRTVRDPFRKVTGRYKA